MGYGASMKVTWILVPSTIIDSKGWLVDYILFLTANVTVTPNFNEIRDYKYVSKDELKEMFDDPGKYAHNSENIWSNDNRHSQSFHAMV